MNKLEILQLPEVKKRVKELEKNGFATHVAEELAVNESGLCLHQIRFEMLGWEFCYDCGQNLSDLKLFNNEK